MSRSIMRKKQPHISKPLQRMAIECDYPMHSPIWKETGRLEMQFPFETVRGLLRSAGRVVYFSRGMMIQRSVGPKNDPKTTAQMRKRQYLGEAQRNWRELTVEQRKA